MILLSGFEAFKNFQVNPSQLLVEHLKLPDIKKVILPVSYEKSFQILKKQIDLNNPQFVLMFGLAQSRDKVSLEQYAYNINDCSLADNEGVLLNNTLIDPMGEKRIETPLKLPTAGEWEISTDPGKYVCNDLYYRTLQYHPCLFIHLPGTKEMGPEYKTEIPALVKIIEDLIKKLR